MRECKHGLPIQECERARCRAERSCGSQDLAIVALMLTVLLSGLIGFFFGRMLANKDCQATQALHPTPKWSPTEPGDLDGGFAE